MRAALHRAAKRENPRRGHHLGARHHPRGGAHACRWVDDDARRPRTPRPPRPRLQRHAWRHALSGGSRVLAADTYDYDAYGNLVASTGSTANEYLYDGQRWDADLGMYHLRARYYEPGRGRFATVDPLNGVPTNPISLNKYLYANADPVNLSDPLGLASLFEYNIQIGPRVYSVALHPAHHSWTILGYKVFCVHLQLLTYLSGVSGSASRIQIPILPFCRFP
jgi:RHS repeat-associated protein